MVLAKRKRGGRSGASQGARRRRKFNMSGKKSLRANTRGQVYAFKRFVSVKVNMVGSDAIPGGAGGVNFQLTDVVNYTEFTNLFDQYKIAGVAYRFVVNKDPMQGTPAVTPAYPRLLWAHDYDDSSTPVLNDLYQYPKVNEFWFTDSRNSTRWNFIKPARAAVEYESATLSSYRPQWKGFIDCASNSAPHYGVKYGYQNLISGMNIYMQCKYYLVFKNVR